jgi:hypothetical protein
MTVLVMSVTGELSLVLVRLLMFSAPVTPLVINLRKPSVIRVSVAHGYEAVRVQ